MPYDKERLAQVIRQIETAFAEVRYPGDDKMLHPDCFDDMDIAAYYGSTSWQEIPAMIIEQENAAFSGASAAAFQFLLPAYMIWVLKNIDDGDMSVQHTIWSLDPEFGRPELHDFKLSKYVLISAHQRAAIIAFLEVFRDDEYFGEDVANALRNYWRADV